MCTRSCARVRRIGCFGLTKESKMQIWWLGKLTSTSRKTSLISGFLWWRDLVRPRTVLFKAFTLCLTASACDCESPERATESAEVGSSRPWKKETRGHTKFLKLKAQFQASRLCSWSSTRGEIPSNKIQKWNHAARMGFYGEKMIEWQILRMVNESIYGRRFTFNSIDLSYINAVVWRRPKYRLSLVHRKEILSSGFWVCLSCFVRHCKRKY